MFDGAVFIDCGSHAGVTLEEAVKPCYGFKTIHAIEPMPNQFAQLRATYGGDLRVDLHNFGLADYTGPADIYGSNDIAEASMYAAKRDVNAAVVTPCQVVEASEFFRQCISADDRNVMKFNCEGAEVPILNNLIDSGEIWKVSNAVITWDCSCIPGEEHHEAELIARMQSIGFDRWVGSVEAFDPPPGIPWPHPAKIAQWLRAIA